jgi:hypothetical protein
VSCILTTESPMPPHPVGLDLFKRVHKLTGNRRALIAFSNGKDGIAAWLAMRDHFEIVPYFLELVPGLEFIEDGLTYYEQFFGTKVIRVPNPAVMRMLRECVFQPPERVPVIDQLDIRPGSYEAINEAVKKSVGWKPDTLCATGLRIQDNLLRRTAIKRHGPVTLGVRKFYPVWDWPISHMVEQFKRANLQLPVDYRMFGRSFDGLSAYYLLPIRKHFPRDFRRILDLYPIAEVIVRRAEKAMAA